MEVKVPLFGEFLSFSTHVTRSKCTLGWNEPSVDVAMEGRYDVGLGLKVHTLMMPIVSNLDCNTYKDIVLGSHVRSLEVWVERRSAVVVVNRVTGEPSWRNAIKLDLLAEVVCKSRQPSQEIHIDSKAPAMVRHISCRPPLVESCSMLDDRVHRVCDP